MGHAKKQAQLIESLPNVFRTVMKRYNLAPGDFPDLEDFKSKLAEQEFAKFNPLKQKLIDEAEQVLSVDFPRLMEALPRSTDAYAPKPIIGGEAAAGGDENPFGAEEEGNPFGDAGGGWALEEYLLHYTSQFQASQVNGFITGAAAKQVLGGSGLPNPSLRKIWELSDTDKDGQLNQYEFTIAMYLIDTCKQGGTLPDKLEAEMLPPK
jgi:EH domain-containing protein 1